MFNGMKSVETKLREQLEQAAAREVALLFAFSAVTTTGEAMKLEDRLPEAARELLEIKRKWDEEEKDSDEVWCGRCGCRDAKDGEALDVAIEERDTLKRQRDSAVWRVDQDGYLACRDCGRAKNRGHHNACELKEALRAVEQDDA
jgi:hypothetical protein